MLLFLQLTVEKECLVKLFLDSIFIYINLKILMDYLYWVNNVCWNAMCFVQMQVMLGDKNTKIFTVF